LGKALGNAKCSEENEQDFFHESLGFRIGFLMNNEKAYLGMDYGAVKEKICSVRAHLQWGGVPGKLLWY